MRQTIWIATDSETSARELETSLRAQYDTTVLPSARALLEWMMNGAPPALVVVESIELCSRLRAIAPTQQILVTTAASAKAASQAGASDVLRTPVDPDELVLRVGNLLSRKRSQNWEELFQQAPIAICMIERPGLLFTFANVAYRDLVGGREVVGKQLLDALPEIAHQGLDSILENVFRTGETYHGKEVTFELAHHGPGEFAILNFTYTARRTATGAVDGVIASVVDVTDQVLARRHAEALSDKLRSSERNLADERNKLAGIFEASPAALALWSGDDLVFQMVNPRYQEMFAGRRLVGRPLLDAVPELRGQPFAALMRTVLETGIPYMGRGESTMLAGPDGILVEHFFDIMYVRIEGSDGRPLGVYDHALDVTDRVLAHRQVVESQTREHQLRQQAEAANRAKDDFLAMLGHEMRNPLAPISTALQLMELSADKAFLMERSVIKRQVDHLTRLVDDLLDTARITSGKIEIRRVHATVASIVADALEIVGPTLERRQHQVTVTVADDLVVDVDVFRMSQVISNLLSNAAKYTEPHGHIRVDAGRADDEIWVAVQDDGVGITRATLQSVFDLFAQEPQAIDRAQGGLGLGLAIVKALVVLHGGSVSAESAGRGKGSRFIVRLPAARAREAVAPPVTQTSAVRSRVPKRVLVVDDNIDAADLLAMSLEQRGHLVRVAHDGPAALRVLESFTPDLAVLDIGLPVIDGYELARRMRQMPALQQVRLIALTGYGQASDRKRSAEAGFDVHLVKPLRLADLDVLIDQN